MKWWCGAQAEAECAAQGSRKLIDAWKSTETWLKEETERLIDKLKLWKNMVSQENHSGRVLLMEMQLMPYHSVCLFLSR